MKRWKLFVCVMIGVLGATVCHAAPSVKEAKEALAAELKQSQYALTPAVRQGYLVYIEAVTREKYGNNKINEATWAWLKQRPQILTAAAAASYPFEPNILLNFQRLGQALGPVRLDQWRQLALAYAIRWRGEPFPIDRVKEEWNPQRLENLVSEMKKGKGGDFALLDGWELPENITEEEIALGEWIVGPQSLGSTRPKMTIPDLMDMPVHEINMMVRKKPDDPPMLTKFPNWDNVAIGGGVHPPYVDGTPTPQRALLMKIFRNGRIPRKSDRPDFKMEKSEWPILLYVADLAEIDETSFIFNYLVKNKAMPALGMGQKASSTGGADINPGDPNFKYTRSNWHPQKFIRLYNGSKKDQGGRAWAWGLNAVNVAATAVAAPPDGKFYFLGEKGNYSHHLTCSDNAYTGEGSSAEWYLAPPCTVDNVDAFSKGGGTFGAAGKSMVLHRNFIGLATTLNQGLQAYEDARIALAVIELMNLPQPRRVSMLESVFAQNPLNQDVMYLLAAEYRNANDAKGTIKMLNAARAYAAIALKRPVNPTKVKTARAALQKVLKSNEATYQGIPVVSEKESPWFFLMCSDVASQFLRDAKPSDMALFREELNYETQAVGGCGDAPITRALNNLRELVK